MINTYLTTDELAARIKYDPRYIREKLNNSILLEGIHYVRPFNRRKILYIWEKIETDFFANGLEIPLKAGGICRG